MHRLYEYTAGEKIKVVIHSCIIGCIQIGKRKSIKVFIEYESKTPFRIWSLAVV